MISILLTARKNSKFLAKWMTGFLKNTEDFSNIEVLVMANREDTWNQDLFELYHDKLKVFYEDSHIGKCGRHEFYNTLAEVAEGDWLWHMCDDHYLLEGYDSYLTGFLSPLDSSNPYMIIPNVNNSGYISQILSRGWYEATGRIGAHGNIDSYLNNVSELIIDDTVIHKPGTPVLHDFTTDPSIMSKEHTKTWIDPDYIVHEVDSPTIKYEIEKDVHAVTMALKKK